MKAWPAVLLVAGALLGADGASAHRIDEYLQATLVSVEAGRIEASMRLIPGEQVAPSVIAAIDADGDGVLSEAEQRAYAEQVLGDLAIEIDHVPAHPRLTAWAFPTPAQMREGLGEIHIDYSVELPAGTGSRSLSIVDHHRAGDSVYLMNALVPRDAQVEVLAQKRNSQQSAYELDFRADAAPPAHAAAAGIGDAWQGMQLSNLFRLGMRHIAEGTDHLLFLLVLLLPAPLVAAGARWKGAVGTWQGLRRILGIVTAFTVGHSATLALSALSGIDLPVRPVEALIALSILVSAVHALRPIFPGREAWVAGGFGLVHGLAFAATLDHLGVELWQRLAGTLAFNVGIEAMQLLLVAAVLPSLMLASRTVAYPWIRRCGALVAVAASLAWLGERLWGIDMGVDPVVDGLVRHAPAMAAALFLASLGFFLARRQPQRG